MNAQNTIEWKDIIFIAVANEQRTGREESGDLRVIPAIRIHREHAIAMAFDRAIDDVIFEIGDSSDGTGRPNAVIERGDQPRVRATAASARHAETSFVHLRPGFEIVQRANAIPGLS